MGDGLLGDGPPFAVRLIEELHGLIQSHGSVVAGYVGGVGKYGRLGRDDSDVVRVLIGPQLDDAVELDDHDSLDGVPSDAGDTHVFGASGAAGALVAGQGLGGKDAPGEVGPVADAGAHQ
ncbi:hypothetical protein [Kineosporia babensis]|uniref:Uncharacterized protein n=1 Tax=Kineosporia babensis TaxID=499548 RepID=A0A9X1NB52_9ACTN|nr:hypothetical protein [Kineosporia babensis]MCD5310865.1 hypothetical protein [Kineosporia babensis]